MRRRYVGVAVHRDRPHAELAACTDDSYGNLASVGNENFRKQWSLPSGR
jgi:hypothetical protein